MYSPEFVNSINDQIVAVAGYVWPLPPLKIRLYLRNSDQYFGPKTIDIRGNVFQMHSRDYAFPKHPQPDLVHFFVKVTANVNRIVYTVYQPRDDEIPHVGLTYLLLRMFAWKDEHRAEPNTSLTPARNPHFIAYGEFNPSGAMGGTNSGYTFTPKQPVSGLGPRITPRIKPKFADKLKIENKPYIVHLTLEDCMGFSIVPTNPIPNSTQDYQAYFIEGLVPDNSRSREEAENAQRKAETFLYNLRQPLTVESFLPSIWNSWHFHGIFKPMPSQQLTSSASSQRRGGSSSAAATAAADDEPDDEPDAPEGQEECEANPPPFFIMSKGPMYLPARLRAPRVSTFQERLEAQRKKEAEELQRQRQQALEAERNAHRDLGVTVKRPSPLGMPLYTPTAPQPTTPSAPPPLLAGTLEQTMRISREQLEREKELQRQEQAARQNEMAAQLSNAFASMKVDPNSLLMTQKSKYHKGSPRPRPLPRPKEEPDSEAEEEAYALEHDLLSPITRELLVDPQRLSSGVIVSKTEADSLEAHGGPCPVSGCKLDYKLTVPLPEKKAEVEAFIEQKKKRLADPAAHEKRAKERHERYLAKLADYKQKLKDYRRDLQEWQAAQK